MDLATKIVTAINYLSHRTLNAQSHSAHTNNESVILAADSFPPTALFTIMQVDFKYFLSGQEGLVIGALYYVIIYLISSKLLNVDKAVLNRTRMHDERQLQP